MSGFGRGMVWSPWKLQRPKAYLCLQWFRDLEISKPWQKEVWGPLLPLIYHGTRGLHWWLNAEVHKAPRLAMPCSRQLSQKCFDKKNKLNLTESLRGWFLIKCIAFTKKQGTERERKENRGFYTYKYLQTLKETGPGQEGVKEDIWFCMGNGFCSVFTGDCTPLNYLLIPFYPWNSFKMFYCICYLGEVERMQDGGVITPWI